MRIALAALGFLLLPLAPAVAGAYPTPEAALDYIYKSYGPESWPEREEVLSDGLMELIRADEARTPEGEIGALDFDPFTDSQDPQPGNVRYTAPEPDGEGRVLVHVTFTNGGDQEYGLDYTLVKEAEGWKVDEITSSNNDFTWSLRGILEEAAGN